jgi:triacylglycerol esterase/lipase EstA (alpha/beta hydrolase family)
LAWSKKTGSKKVNLIGHSAGGGVCMTLVNDKKMGKSVERYVHLASMPVTENRLYPH